jgi:5-methyltetrahydropteroyltriglutamate--homocysteine methyltransferase
MTQRTQPPFRADHVGSFLRPKALQEARARRKKGEIDAAALRAVEDASIREIVAAQESWGLQGITDGEFRRTYFHIDFLEQLQGVEVREGMAIKFRGAANTVDFAPPVLHVTGKLKHVKPIQLADFQFLKSVTTRTPKVTIPSPTMLHFRGGRGAISREAYPDMEEFFADVAKCYQDEIRTLAEAGCTYLQLDDTNLAYLCDPKMREGARQRGDDPDELPRKYARLINACIAGKPDSMQVSIHLCRGNFQSAWAAEGGYEPVAKALFQELAVDGYFLEYDDERSGGFSPLRFVPAGKTIVLGIVSSKLPALEPVELLKSRIDEASHYVQLEQLCLSPQCGFSSTEHGNQVTPADQEAKMRHVVATAHAVWG